MRPVIVQISGDRGGEVLELAKKSKGKNVSLVKGRDTEKELEIISLYLSNRKVEGFISDVTKIDNAEITLFPLGVMTLYPPANKAPEQVADVELRSPIEIFLAGLQSKGSWKGFISYSVISSIVVWIGLYTNTSYLLVAAMLIAPFAGPAMNTAIATSRGDAVLLRQSLIRYFASILITIAGTAILSLIYQQEIATTIMIERSQISSVAALLALAAGAAGAINLIQSERDSLVSGAAVGMLVAASLAPPAGIIGMAIAIGKWEMIKSGVFLLFLQLIGINLTGSLVFKLAGLNSTGTRYEGGKKSIFITSMGFTGILLAGILFWQFYSVPELQRASISQRSDAIIQNIINKHPQVGLIETNARFTRSDIRDQNTLLCEVYIQKKDKDLNESVLKADLTKEISMGIKQKYNDVIPIVDLIILEKQE
ncbi:MAG: DUF389 domain-containing protein [Bacteroidota bacterium]|nr:DUF389 domain-containing protein [Bacteroidota bacterium]